MAIHDKSLDKIREEDLRSLVENQVREGLQIEYKERLPGNAESEKKEFLADVSSFANASGGDIVYGVKDKRDEQGNATGVPEEVCGIGQVNLNLEQQRLENILQYGLMRFLHYGRGDV